MKTPPQRILVVPLRFIGDTVLTVPVLRAIRQTWPQARIDLRLPAYLHNLFEPSPYIDRIVLDHKSFGQNLRQTRENQYDLAILLRRSLSQAVELKLAGVPCVAGFNEQRLPNPLGFKPWGLGLDRSVPFVPVDTEIPQVKTLLSVLGPLTGNALLDERLELWTTPEDEAFVAGLLTALGIENGSKIAVFHATSASREKSLSPELYVAALQTLHQAGFSIVCVGTSSDVAFYRHMEQISAVPMLNLCGKTTLRQTVALLKHAQLLLSLDSGPVHLAAAVGVPHIIAIYGPTNHKQWAPYPYEGQFTPVFHPDLTCRPCEAKVCSHNHCRTQMNAVWIRDAVAAHLADRSPERVL